MIFNIIARLRYPWKLEEQFLIVQQVPCGLREWLDFGDGFFKQHQGDVRALATDTYSRGSHQRTGLLTRPQAEGAHERLVRNSNILNPVDLFSHVSSLDAVLVLSGTT